LIPFSFLWSGPGGDDTVNGADRKAKFATRAVIEDNGMHKFTRADDCGHGTDLDAKCATDAVGLADHYPAWQSLGIERRFECSVALAGNPVQ